MHYATTFAVAVEPGAKEGVTPTFQKYPFS